MQSKYIVRNVALQRDQDSFVGTLSSYLRIGLPQSVSRTCESLELPCDLSLISATKVLTQGQISESA